MPNNSSLIKNESTRLRFSVWVIIFNFIMGIVGMYLGSDLTSLGVFLAMSNAPLYVYVLGRSFRPAQISEEYFKHPSSGSGGYNNYTPKDDSNLTTDRPPYEIG